MIDYDTRDGAPDEDLRYKTYSDKLGHRFYRERAISGCAIDHVRERQRLLDEAHKRGETVLACTIHNFAVSIAVETPDSRNRNLIPNRNENTNGDSDGRRRDSKHRRGRRS